MTTQQHNARFWIYWNGWAKLTIAPGATVELTNGGRTDEGYYYHVEQYEHDGDGIERRITSWGSDCDGPYERSEDAYCKLDRLAARCVDDPMPGCPMWERQRANQRDHYAELMGY